MLLAGTALFSQLPVYTAAIQPAIAAMAPRGPLNQDSYSQQRAIPDFITTGVKLTIGTSGGVEDCVVTSTSGWPKLDQALCDSFNRARFYPTSGASGGSGIFSRLGESDRLWTPGTYRLNIQWKPPRICDAGACNGQ